MGKREGFTPSLLERFLYEQFTQVAYHFVYHGGGQSRPRSLLFTRGDAIWLATKGRRSQTPSDL